MVNMILDGGSVQWAQRQDGQWFRRVQYRDATGFRWSPWTEIGSGPEMQYSETTKAARLPKAA